MLSKNILLIFSLLGSALAVDFSNWSPPGPNDVRSPCPGLNTLANHNFLPHDGRGISVAMFQNAMEEALNFGLDIRTVLAIGGLFASSNPLAGTVDLDELDKHDYIEHDGSMSRLAISVDGDDHSFNQEIFDSVMAFYGDQSHTTVAQASAAHLHNVERDAKLPGFTYGPKQHVLGYTESTLALVTMGDPTTGIAPVDYIKIMFEQERFPYNEGWRPPTTQITLGVAGNMAKQLASHDNELGHEIAAINNRTITMALLGLDSFNEAIPDTIQNFLDDFGLSNLL